ncbi:hypothetical protein IRJ41_011391 [Triplophysa rosa]|uniref:Sterile alpha motif domain-containing protein 3 n=1 Tax=Triplophysa rosa TaxID=992332 RepID=A0A9W7T4L5_TRIRA|nr:hypothetical protein IRJ41_011391 [Triplophysa rosa]
MNLTSVSEIEHKSTLKVIYLPASSLVEPHIDEPFITLYPVNTFDETTTCSEPQTSSIDSSCDDRQYASAPHSSTSTETPSGLSPWPKVFFELSFKNAAFETNGTYFNPGPKLKGIVLNALAQEMVKYTKYPKDYQCEEVAAALTRAHPCLGQLGSKTGFWGWKQSLKYKMQNYRTKLCRLGHPEVCVNSLRNKRKGQGKPAANIKKPKKAEVNYIHLHPKGESTERLEQERIALLTEVKKRDNEVVIKAKMEKTFSYRRQQIVEQRPMIEEFKNQWPALFQQSEVNAEFMRITTKPLQSTFLSELDRFSDKLMQILQSRGGVKGQKIKNAMMITDSCDNINIKRECILKVLILYLNEDPDSFFKDYVASAIEDAEKGIANTVMGIYTIRGDGSTKRDDVGIVIEGIKVMSNLDCVILAFIMLNGLIYALDLSFPDNLKNTYEFIQKILMNLDGHKLTTKIQHLKIKLFE